MPRQMVVQKVPLETREICGRTLPRCSISVTSEMQGRRARTRQKVHDEEEKKRGEGNPFRRTIDWGHVFGGAAVIKERSPITPRYLGERRGRRKGVNRRKLA